MCTQTNARTIMTWCAMTDTTKHDKIYEHLTTSSKMTNFKHFEKTVTNQNHIHEEVKSR